jgi:hypothetical protein
MIEQGTMSGEWEFEWLAIGDASERRPRGSPAQENDGAERIQPLQR